MNRSQVLHKSDKFELRRVKRRKTDKVYYEIKLMVYATDEWCEGVRDIVDPLRNKSGRFGTHWKFRSYDEAEKLMTALLLRS